MRLPTAGGPLVSESWTMIPHKADASNQQERHLEFICIVGQHRREGVAGMKVLLNWDRQKPGAKLHPTIEVWGTLVSGAKVDPGTQQREQVWAEVGVLSTPFNSALWPALYIAITKPCLNSQVLVFVGREEQDFTRSRPGPRPTPHC